MRRRVIPAGVSLKDFHGWAGSLDRIDVGYNIDPRRAWRTHTISRFAGRVTHENFTVPEGTSLRRPLITISRTKNS